jgi:hypothetical protein
MAIASGTSTQSAVIPAATATLDDSTLWIQYLNALMGVTGQASLDGLMAGSVAETFDIGDSNPQKVNQAIYQFANPLPEWQMIYSPSEVSLFTQYGLFLNGLQLVQQDTSPDLQAQLTSDQASLRANVLQLQDDLNAGMPAEIIASDEGAVNASQQAVTNDLEQINGPNYMVLGADLTNYQMAQFGIKLNSLGNQLTMPTPSSTSTPVQVPAYTLSDYSQWLTTAAANAASNPPIFQEVLTFNESSSSSYSGSFTTASAQDESIFFGWYNSSQSSWSSVSTQGGQQVSYTVTAQLPGVALLDVQPGGWFDGTLIQDFQNGPFLQDSPFSTQPAFGASGIFNLMVSQVLVAYMPTVTVQFDESSWSSFYSVWTSSDCSALSIGPFYANSSSNSNAGYSGTASYDGSNFTVTFTYNTPVPVILGVVADVLP